MFSYRLLNAFLRALIRMLTKVEIEGMKNMPLEGPLILMVNHINFIDAPLACGLMARRVIPMAKVELFRIPIFRLIAGLYGAFPVRRGKVDRSALYHSLEVLEAGQALLIAPEGTRSHHGELQKARRGIAYIALRTGVPILPVAIWGQERFFSNLKRLRRTQVHIRVGKPFRFVSGGGKMGRDKLRAMTGEAMYQLAALLPSEYRGVYSDLSAATTDFICLEEVKVHPC